MITDRSTDIAQLRISIIDLVIAAELIMQADNMVLTQSTRNIFIS